MKDIIKLIINAFKSLLVYVAVAEDRKSISISNVLVWLVMYKIYSNPVMSASDIVLLIGVLGNYIHRRVSKKPEDKPKDSDEVQ